MKKFWDGEEVELLKAMVLADYSNEDIAKELDRPINSIAAKKKRLNICKPYSKFTDEELLEFLRRDEHPTSTMYSTSKDRPYPKIYQKRFGSWNNALILAGHTPNPAGGTYKWSDEELIQILSNEKVHLTREAFSLVEGYPNYQVYHQRFGSWSKSLELAGHTPNRFGYDSSAPTTVYLVYFIKDNFYKIGITQRSLKDRFVGYPEYTTIFTETTSLEVSSNTEDMWLSTVQKYRYIPYCFGTKSGKTECFKLPADKKIVIDFPTLTVV